MFSDPLQPAVDSPPRTLYDWTTVEGHEVTDVNRGRARCVCGEYQPVHELLRRTPGLTQQRDLTAEQRIVVRQASRDWRADHLANAWPVLVQRVEGETLDEHARHIAEDLAVARAERDRLDAEMDKTGEAIPTFSDAQTEVGMRAAVLKHQYNQICRKLQRQHEHDGTDGTDEAMRWMVVEGVGAPLDEL